MKRLLLRLIGFCVRLYYRTNRFGNEVPDEGPVLLVANHPNGLIDPILIGQLISPKIASGVPPPRIYLDRVTSTSSYSPSRSSTVTLRFA